MPTDIVPYEVPPVDSELELDFLDYNSLEALEDGIRKIEATTDALALVQGIGILKIEREGLWMQGDYPNLQSYRQAQGERLGMPRSTISRRRKTAEGYLDNRKLLGKTPLSGNISKLAYLNDALRIHERREVLAHFKGDSFREFEAWAYPRLAAPDMPDVSMSIEGDDIVLDGTPMLSFEEDLDPAERDFIARILQAAYRARRGNLLPHIVAVYDQGEARALENALKKIREGK